MTETELFYTLALTKVPGIGVRGARHLLHAVGNASTIFTHSQELESWGIDKRFIKILREPAALAWAEKELEFMRKNRIACFTAEDDNYPRRLRECDDAPLVLYYKGSADLNALRVISIVGTRKATEYGKLLCKRFVDELKEICPGTLIVSGLAYGIDICAHRAALEKELDTVAVLAHGLDRIYPASHRQEAVAMIEKGGLLTEFMSDTFPDRSNFIRRNRIVAGMSDATVVIESASKGGALVTAEIAQSYHKDCFAFPGRVSDEYSAGCNNLIKENRASLILSAEDFVKAMCWDTAKKKSTSQPLQRQLFPELSIEEQGIVTLLKARGELQMNMLVVEADIPVPQMSALLFDLEMKGVVGVRAGGMYYLIS